MLRPGWIDDGSTIPDPLGHGENMVSFLRMLRHPKSRAPGRTFELDPWQERIVRRIYGPRHPDGTRIVRRVVLLLPRGNRKTSLCAALTLAHLVGPAASAGNTIISAASAHEQAMELFNEAALIVQHDPRLQLSPEHVTILRDMDDVWVSEFYKSRNRPEGVKTLPPVSKQPLSAALVDVVFG